MNVAICCISKGEELYLVDWLEYHKKLGFCNVIVNDNSDVNDNKQRDILDKYIKDGFVIYQDYRGKSCYQNKSYEETYSKYNKNFDWIAFFDIDEFICLEEKYKTISDFMSEPFCEKSNLIYVNWKCYGDNDNIHYENKPVWERFTKPEPMVIQDGTYVNKKQNINEHIKSFVKCVSGKRIKFNVPHNAMFSDEKNNVINPKGEKCKSNSPFQKVCWENMWINHYYTLSLEEFLDRRVNRGRATVSKNRTYDELFKSYFTANKKTPEKEKHFKEYYNKIKKNLATNHTETKSILESMYGTTTKIKNKIKKKTIKKIR